MVANSSHFLAITVAINKLTPAGARRVRILQNSKMMLQRIQTTTKKIPG